MSLTRQELERLAERGITVDKQVGDDLAECRRGRHRYVYTITDLKALARPSAVSRIRQWLARGVAA